MFNFGISAKSERWKIGGILFFLEYGIAQEGSQVVTHLGVSFCSPVFFVLGPVMKVDLFRLTLGMFL